MWNKIISFLQSLVGYADRLDKCERQVESLYKEMRDLTDTVNLLSVKMEYNQESQKDQHEKLLLQLENQLLKFEKRLPPPQN